MKFTTVREIVDSHLCLGCGACAYICPEHKIKLVDVVSEGVRPLVANERCGTCEDCLRVCPAFRNDHRPLLDQHGLIEELKSAFGPALEIWEGYAIDPTLRWMGSSGGALTALSLYALERRGAYGVLHVAGDPLNPIRNRTQLSRTRAQLLAATGSRYSPASACDGLRLIEDAPFSCVFIGQPSEVTALRKAEAMRPGLHERIELALSFLCAGSPSTRGTQELLRSLGVPEEEVSELRYRGRGWPGSFAVRRRGQSSLTALMSYDASWGLAQRFRPFSVHLTPDGSGEDADISCGDPWYNKPEGGEPGRSLIIVRTERGREFLRCAHGDGYLYLRHVDVSAVLGSQSSLVRKRGSVWGRLLALRLLGLPSPHLSGFSLFRNWIRLPVHEQLRSVFGTVRRILRRKYYLPLKMPIAEADVLNSDGTSQHSRV
jgi:coenzyme F420 hydrogenase subunit beta